MKSIKLDIPATWNCHVVGQLYESANPRDLSEDMLEVRLPNGLLICVGWFTNEYLISVVNGLEDEVPPISVGSPDELRDRIVDTVFKFKKQFVRTSSTAQTNTSTERFGSRVRVGYRAMVSQSGRSGPNRQYLAAQSNG